MFLNQKNENLGLFVSQRNPATLTVQSLSSYIDGCAVGVRVGALDGKFVGDAVGDPVTAMLSQQHMESVSLIPKKIPFETV